MEKTIYTVTTLRSVLMDSRSRCVGYYHDFKDAEEIVLDNVMDINEMGYYLYAVIEEVSPGIYTFPRPEYWYKWDVSKAKYVDCSKPEKFMRTVGWSMG